MPRPRKPAGQLVDRRPQRTEGRLVPLPSSKTEPPAPARTWLKPIRDAWREFWASDLAAAVDPADHLALRRLYELYDERARLMKGYRAERLVAGSTGQMKLNPCFTAAVTLDKAIADAEGAFGITPLKRSRLGLTYGQASLTLEDLINRQNQAVADDDDPRDDDPRDDPRAEAGGAEEDPTSAG